MKYISYDRLREIITSCIAAKVYPGIWVLDECKELPPPQWQTIEDFKANPVDGCAFVKNISLDVPIMTYTKHGVFYATGSFMDSEFISHVMPIKTPEAPK